MTHADETVLPHPPLSIPLAKAFGLGPTAAVTLVNADELMVEFRCRDAEFEPAIDYGVLGRVRGWYDYNHDARRYVARHVQMSDWRGIYSYESEPAALSADNLPSDWRSPGPDDRPRLVEVAQALVACGKIALDADRRRFVEIERDMRADEGDRMRQDVAEVELRRQELEHELDL